MSHLNSSLAFEELAEQEEEIELKLIIKSHMLESNVILAKAQPIRVAKVRGSITISF